MPLKHTRIEVSNAVFSLPYYVAKEKRFFAEEGYDVELVPAGSKRPFRRASRARGRTKQRLRFPEDGKVEAAAVM